MKVIVVTALKGGVGKSTLSAMLAVCAVMDGRRVAVFDADPIRTLSDWHALRGSPEQPLLMQAESAVDAVDHAQRAKMDWLIIDTPPNGIPLIEAAIRQSDLVLVPVRPSPLDLLSVGIIKELITQQGRTWAFVLSQVPVKSTFVEETRRQLSKVGHLLSAQIGFHEEVAVAMGHGQTGSDHLPGRAGQSIQEEAHGVFEEVGALLKGRPRRQKKKSLT